MKPVDERKQRFDIGHLKHAMKRFVDWLDEHDAEKGAKILAEGELISGEIDEILTFMNSIEHWFSNFKTVFKEEYDD